MLPNPSRRLPGVLFFLLVFAAFASAQDFSQWRGTNRDGAITGFVAPKVWPEQLKSKWKVQVGVGHSSPLIVGQTVYLHSRQGENEVVAAYNLETGKTLWSDSYPVAYTMNSAATGHGKGPKSTPVASNGRLYTLGITGVLSCYDLAKGKLAWRKDFGQRFGEKAPDFGTASSPMVDRGLVILHAGGDTKGGLVALDAVTGNEKWAWTQDGPAYASPIAVDIAGKRQIVTQSRQNIVGIWADNGGLLWKIPFDTEYVQNIVTPVVYNDLLIFSGINKGVFAVRVGWKDNKWATDTVWHNKEVSMYMNSPVLSGNLLFGLSHKNKGQFFCLDASSGKTLWTGDPRQGENAAMLIAGNTIFSLTNDAELIVTSAANKAATPLKKYKVAGSATWAHPAISGKRILIKDENSLALLSLE
ncbi:MAG TPA: PQQ-like beta-propeller repeat protein [Blastocatellia bacterium]|nr:PQQ-like beta-propeller repeat protein [Blastocatellia bacterium]HMV81509.1 PQQ-like beta-propeller repeat protein [Blastocatellia bacterium]HMX26043.1 PQQ-like beta-propeller repeat protein [Blastocatellia bacterium]HMY75527.1 PQQ-like beta-propeller repeat protein [Blastocatellia bacterium]HMZ21686.1 PQQ-like beta-propeller repeat protein [Blastocatellia bacterium]